MHKIKLSFISHACSLAFMGLLLSSCARSGPHTPAPVEIKGGGRNTHLSSSKGTIVAGLGDTVYSIAYKNHISTKELIRANNLKPPFTLVPGQELVLPGSNYDTGHENEDEDIQGATVIEQGRRMPAYDSGSAVQMEPLDRDVRVPTLMPRPSDSKERTEITSLPGEPRPLGQTTPTSTKSTNSPLHLSPAKPNNQDTSGLEDSASSKKERVNPEEIAAQKIYGKEEKKPDPTKKDSAAPLPKQDQKKLEEGTKALKPSSTDSALGDQKSQTNPAQKTEEVKLPQTEPISSKPSQDNESFPPSNGPKLSWPLQGKILSQFGEKHGKLSKPTQGLVIGAPEGTPIKAVAPGEVFYAGKVNGDEPGKTILIKHSDGTISIYTHTKSHIVKKGDKVAEGQEIGTVGVGDDNAPQLYLRILKNKKPVNPEHYLK